MVTPFEVKFEEITLFGSHEPETALEIWKREEFEKLEKLLSNKGLAIERMAGDGNCLYRAVA